MNVAVVWVWWTVFFLGVDGLRGGTFDFGGLKKCLNELSRLYAESIWESSSDMRNYVRENPHRESISGEALDVILGGPAMRSEEEGVSFLTIFLEQPNLRSLELTFLPAHAVRGDYHESRVVRASDAVSPEQEQRELEDVFMRCVSTFARQVVCCSSPPRSTTWGVVGQLVSHGKLNKLALSYKDKRVTLFKERNCPFWKAKGVWREEDIPFLRDTGKRLRSDRPLSGGGSVKRRKVDLSCVWGGRLGRSLSGQAVARFGSGRRSAGHPQKRLKRRASSDPVLVGGSVSTDPTA